MGEEIKCRRCGGEGKVPTSYVSWDKCPVCRGTGKLPPEKKEVIQAEGIDIANILEKFLYKQGACPREPEFTKSVIEFQSLLKSRDEELIGEIEKLEKIMIPKHYGSMKWIKRCEVIDLIRKREVGK